MRTRVYRSLAELPEGYAGFFQAQVGERFFFGLPWFRTLIDATVEPHESLHLYAVECESGRPAALLLTRSPAGQNGSVLRDRWIGARSLAGLTNTQTSLFGPLLSGAQRSEWPSILRRLVAAVVADERAWDVVDLNLLARDEPVFPMLIDAFRSAGMVPRPYLYKGNWYELTEGMSWRDYLETRPKPARKALQNYARKRRRLEETGRVRFELIDGDRGLEAGIAAYHHVYAASWKEPEPYPRFAEALIRASAAAGCLRLGIVHVDAQPVAIEFAVVAGGRATMMKTAYDEKLSRESVGAIAIQYVLEHLLDVDRVREVDFGTDDDAYKRTWVTRRRERWGILAFAPRTLRGSLGLVRQLSGEAASAGRELVKPFVKPVLLAARQLVQRDKPSENAT